MKKEKKMQRRRFDAKKTAVGRFVCRLIGDTAGQALMEYVVICVLIVSAIVATLLIFSKTLRYEVQIMYYSATGQVQKAEAIRAKMDAEIETETPVAEGNGSHISTGSNGPQ